MPTTPPGEIGPSWLLAALVTLIEPPVGARTRTALLPESATKTLPDAFNARPEGPFSEALDAMPPSPVYPRVSLPAIVVMIPEGKTLRTRRLPSATYRLPKLSNATATGLPTG